MPHTSPRAVTVSPPSYVTFAPARAVVPVIAVTAVVVTEGTVFGAVRKVVSTPSKVVTGVTAYAR